MDVDLAYRETVKEFANGKDPGDMSDESQWWASDETAAMAAKGMGLPKDAGELWAVLQMSFEAGRAYQERLGLKR